jgi:hypothetical protein
LLTRRLAVSSIVLRGPEDVETVCAAEEEPCGSLTLGTV